MQATVISAGTVPQPATAGKKPNLMEMLNASSVQTPAHVGYGQPQQPTGYGMGGIGMGGSMGMGGNIGMGGGGMGMMGMNMGGHRQTPSLSSNPSQFSSPMAPPLQPQQPNLFGGGGGSLALKPTSMGGNQASMSNSSAKAPTKTANFDDLWSMSLGSGSSSSAKSSTIIAGKSIKDLEKEKAQAGIWGGSQQKLVGDTFGGFGNAPPHSPSGGDDLLL